MEDLTQEQVEKSIAAAFDSVALIDTLQAKVEKTDEDNSSIERNTEHLRIMMSKDWFVTALSETQKTQINNLIN